MVVMEAFLVRRGNYRRRQRVAIRLARKPANGRYDALSVPGSIGLRQSDNEGVAC
jgi:hypothetical protein